MWLNGRAGADAGDTNIATCIRDQRLAHKLTQADLAEKLKVSLLPLHRGKAAHGRLKQRPWRGSKQFLRGMLMR
jgi:transcriptional regulator with XRE-family HTH domain